MNKKKIEFYLRCLLPKDADEAYKLVGEWFPVKYTKSLIEEMCNPENSYFTLAAISKTQTLLGFIINQFEWQSQIESEVWNFTSKKRVFPDCRNAGCHILILGVKKEYRSNGIAYELINQTINESIKKKGCFLLYLHTLDTNTPAIKFYYKCGFKGSTPLLFETIITLLYKFKKFQIISI